LGLKYIPSSEIEPATTQAAFTKFQRGNRLKHYFKDSATTEHHPFKATSNWEPPKASRAIEQYLDRVEKGLDDLNTIPITSNLNRAQNIALRELANDPTLVIKSADKGSGIVVEDRTNYIRDGLTHLSDENVYAKLDSDPTTKLGEAINRFTLSLYDKGVVDSITKNYLLFSPDNMPRTQQMYFLKKIHKSPTAVRPICSGCGGATEKISKLVDHYLQPFVPKIESHIKDSGHLIHLIENTTLPIDCTIGTIDVKAMYTNIPHGEGIKAIKNRLYTQNHDLEVPIPPGAMSDLLTTVLTKNYFQFVDQMYHQVQGTAMGTRMAPSYANLFMADLEEKLLAGYHIKPILWKRYIDDILIVWPGDQDSLRDFVRYLNNAHPTIKFTYECSNTSVDFLDLTLYKGVRFNRINKLDIKPFFKHTNKFQYLMYNSAHPRNTFGSLIKGELTRLLRACSDAHQYSLILTKMLTIFKERGYPNNLILRVIATVPYQNRQHLIDKGPTQPRPYETFMVLEYTPDIDVKKLKSLITPSEQEKEHIPKPCLSFKKARNISHSLVRGKLSNVKDPPKSTETINIYRSPYLEGRSAMCGHNGCKCCKAMSKKVSIHSSHNHKSFRTTKYSNCSSSNVIYLLECKKCTKHNQYVGQTNRKLSERAAGHRAKAKLTTSRNLPLYKHFAGRDHDFETDAKFSVLEKTTKNQLLVRESHWINTLETVHPKGLNNRYELR